MSREFGPAKFFRPYRDVRFAKDKTPYKTHQGVWFGDSSRYLHVSGRRAVRRRRVLGGRPPPRSSGCAGPWPTTSPAPNSTGPSPPSTKARLELNGPQLTRVPSGYPKDHPRAELLRYKSLTAHREFGAPAWLTSKRAQSEVVKALRSIAPLIGWLDTHVGGD